MFSAFQLKKICGVYHTLVNEDIKQTLGHYKWWRHILKWWCYGEVVVTKAPRILWCQDHRSFQKILYLNFNVKFLLSDNDNFCDLTLEYVKETKFSKKFKVIHTNKYTRWLQSLVGSWMTLKKILKIEVKCKQKLIFTTNKKELKLKKKN